MGNSCCKAKRKSELNSSKFKPPSRNRLNPDSANQLPISHSQQLPDIVPYHNFKQTNTSEMRKNKLSFVKSHFSQRHMSKTVDNKLSNSKAKHDTNPTPNSTHANQSSSSQIRSKHRNSLTLQKYPGNRDENTTGF